MKQWCAIYCAEGNNIIKEEEERERLVRGPTQQHNILNLGGIKLFSVTKLSCEQTNHHLADTSTTALRSMAFFAVRQ